MNGALARPRIAIAIAGFVAACAALFWPTFVWMAERFDTHDSFYSHGWLIPPAVAWLIWQRRAQLMALPNRPTFAGLALLVPALVLQVLAGWLSIGFAAGFAMLAVIYGLVWTCFGWPILWVLRFPLLFLIFMVPLPGVLLIEISFRMKLAAASLATWVMNLIGVPSKQAGSTIYVAASGLANTGGPVPTISVIVDDTCSGLRSLISLIALSTLWLALMPRATWWQKMVVVAGAIPIALTANMARITLLVLLTAIYGPQIAESILHYGSGIVMFGVAVLVLMWLSRTVQQWSWPALGPNRSPSSS